MEVRKSFNLPIELGTLTKKNERGIWIPVSCIYRQSTLIILPINPDIDLNILNNNIKHIKNLLIRQMVSFSIYVIKKVNILLLNDIV